MKHLIGIAFAVFFILATALLPSANGGQKTISKNPPKGSYIVTVKPHVSASKNGWWIRVNLSKQEAPQIVFIIGTSNHNAEAWRIWNTGQEAEFDVPEKFKNVNPLYIKANSTDGKNSWFCMMYKGDGVKHFDFDDDEDHEEKQSDRDGECS
jgi:hypothetical protein